MTKNFKIISKDQLVVDAAKFMGKHKIYSLVVSDDGEVSGFITMHEILQANVL
jgi:predicted transcriptional regulator